MPRLLLRIRVSALLSCGACAASPGSYFLLQSRMCRECRGCGGMATTERQRDLAEAHALYERYVKPLDAEHRGEYAAVLPDGRLVLGPTFVDAAHRALGDLGPGSHVYKVGELAVGGWK